MKVISIQLAYMQIIAYIRKERCLMTVSSDFTTL